MSAQNAIVQIAPGNFPEPQQRALNDALNSLLAADRTLLDNFTINNLGGSSTLGDTMATVNAILTVLRALGLRGA